MTTTPRPGTEVVRVSRGNFVPSRFDEVQAMTAATGRYLIPAIRQLPGLISYHAGVSADGSIVHVSIWESGDAANQMSTLKEMIIDARAHAEQAGVVFTPIVNYPVDWSI